MLQAECLTEHSGRSLEDISAERRESLAQDVSEEIKNCQINYYFSECSYVGAFWWSLWGLYSWNHITCCKEI